MGPPRQVDTLFVNGRAGRRRRGPPDRRPRRDRPPGRRDRAGAGVSTTRTGRELKRGRIGESVLRADGVPEGAGALRVRLRPVGRRDALGRDAAQPAPERARAGHRDRRGARGARRPRGADPRGRPGPAGLRHGDRRPAGAGHRRGALPGRAGGDRRRRPPRDGAPGGDPDRGRLRAARGAHRPPTPRSPTGARPLHPGGNLLRSVPIRHGDPDAEAEVVVRGDYEVGMQDQAFLGPGVGARDPGRGRRHRPLHRHPVAPRRPGPGGRQPRAARSS